MDSCSFSKAFENCQVLPPQFLTVLNASDSFFLLSIDFYQNVFNSIKNRPLPLSQFMFYLMFCSIIRLLPALTSMM